MKPLRTSIVLMVILIGAFTAESQAEDDIRIGVSVSGSGKYMEPSAMIHKAVQLWENEINASGGLLGRKVRVIWYDDKSDVALVGELYRRLIEEDKVDLVFSPYGTPLTLEATRITETRGLLMLACGAAGESIWQRGHQYVLGMYAPADRMFIGLLDILAQQGQKGISVIYDETSEFNIDVVKGIEKWAARFKMTLLDRIDYRDGMTDLPAVLAQCKQNERQVLLMSAYPTDCYHLLQIMEKIGYKPPVLGMTIAPAHPEFLERAGPVGELVFGPSQWEPDERIPFPGTKRFIQAFLTFTGQLPSYHAGSAYAACQLYAQAVAATQSLDNRKLRDYIAALDTVTVIGRFKVDPSGMQIGHNAIIIQWQQGKKEIVWPRKMRTAQPIVPGTGS